MSYVSSSSTLRGGQALNEFEDLCSNRRQPVTPHSVIVSGLLSQCVTGSKDGERLHGGSFGTLRPRGSLPTLRSRLVTT